MTLNSVLFRSGTVLPEKFAAPGKTAYEGWVSAGPENAQQVEASVRASGWHFMCLTLVSSCAGIGLTADAATHKAFRSSLKRLSDRFNAAEIVAMTTKKYLGFHAAHVTLTSRHVQESGALSMTSKPCLKM